MAYGLKYELLCTSKINSNAYKLELLFDGYTGAEINKDIPADSPLVLRKDKAAVIRGTSLDFGIRETVDFELDEFYTNDPKKIKAKLYKDATLLWTGYSLPQQYQAPYISSPVSVRFTATDGLGLLKNEKYNQTGTNSQLATIIYCVDKIGLALGYSIAINLFETTHNHNLSPLEQTYVDSSIFNGLDCYAVIERILEVYDAEITQVNDRWHITRSTDKKSTRMLYTTAGVYETTAAAPAVLDLGYPTTTGIEVWPVNQLSRNMEPGAKQVTIKHNFGRKNSLLDNYDFRRYAGGAFASWTKLGTFNALQYIKDGKAYAHLSGYSADNTMQIYQTIAVSNVIGEDFVFEMNFAPIGRNVSSGAVRTILMTVRMAILLTNGVTDYYLSKTNGWTTTSTIIEETVYSSLSSPTWNTIKIITAELPFSGNMTVALYRFCGAPIGGDTYNGVDFSEPNVYFLHEGELYASGLETVAVFDNSKEPGDLGTISILAADAPALANIGLLYKNITRLSNGTPTTVWHILGDATEYSQVIQLARTLASNNRVARQVLKGTIKGTGISFDSIIKHAYNSNKEFELSEIQWDLYNETYQVTLLELFAWSSETITFTAINENANSGTATSGGSIIGVGLGNDAGTSLTAADILTKLLTVDGATSGLDADLLDGNHGSYYAPLASPTFIGNVNFPGSGIWNSSGNVGIGTTTPGAKLDILAGNTIADLGFKIKQGSATDDTFQTLFTIYNNLNVEQMAVRSRGSDGVTIIELPAIRTTAARDSFGQMFLTSGSAAQGIQVENIIMGVSYLSDISGLNANTLYGSNTASGNLTLQSTSDSTKGYVLLNPTSGNVGIGTTGPGAKLDVAGDILANSQNAGAKIMMGALPEAPTSYAGVWLAQTSPSASNYLLLGSGYQSFINAPNISIADIEFRIGNNSHFQVGNNGASINGTENITPPYPLQVSNAGKTATLMTILDGGNVGIGTTGPGAKLEINNTAAQPALSIGDSGVDNGSSYGMVNLTRPADLTRAHLAFICTGTYVWQMGYVQNTNTLGIFPWNLTSGGIPAMAFATNGNVGIGTTNLRTKLDIGNADSFPADLIGLYDGGANVRYGIGIDTAAAQSGMVFYSGDRGFTFKTQNITNTAGTQLMTILNGGNVGIGTTAPSVLLEVAGTGIKSEVLQSSIAYSSGFFGDGYKIIETGGETTAEFDNLIVRKLLKAFTLEVDKIDVVGGSLVISPASGTAYSVTNVDVTHWNIIFDTNNNTNPIQFNDGDYIAAQTYKNYDHTIVDSFRGHVMTSGVHQSATLGSAYIQCESCTGTPWVGMRMAQLGSSTDSARQNLIYLTSADSNNPYIEGHTEVTTGVFSDATRKFRLGNLVGITDPVMGALTGYGLYSQNVFLSGKIIASSGTIGSWFIDADAIYTGTKHIEDFYTTGGITLAGNGGIHAKNFSINADGVVNLIGEQPHNIHKIPSDNIRNSYDAEMYTTSDIYVKLKTIHFTNGLLGSQRIKFQIKSELGVGYTVYAELRHNGVSIGAVQTTDSTTYIEKVQTSYEDWLPGDTLELWVHRSTSGKAYTEWFGVCYDDGAPTVAVANTIS